MISPEKKLEELLNQYSQETEHDNTNNRESDDQNGFTDLNKFFDRIYILALTDKGPDLESRILSHGLSNYEIFDKVNSNKSFMENLYEIIKDAQQKQHSQILVVKDSDLIHKDIRNEFIHHSSILGNDWHIIYAGGTISTTLNQFDAGFYLSTYEDLAKARITTEQAAQKHWRTYGNKEGRYGGRYLSHPDSIRDISAIGIRSDVYPALLECLNPKKGNNVGINLAKFYKDHKGHSWVVVPNLFQSELNKNNRTRIRANGFMYE